MVTRFVAIHFAVIAIYQESITPKHVVEVKSALRDSSKKHTINAQWIHECGNRANVIIIKCRAAGACAIFLQ